MNNNITTAEVLTDVLTEYKFNLHKNMTECCTTRDFRITDNLEAKLISMGVTEDEITAIFAEMRQKIG